MHGVDCCLLEIMVGHETDHLSVKAEYGPVRGSAQMHRVVGDRLKNGSKVSCRAAYDAQHLRSRCLLFYRFLELAGAPAELFLQLDAGYGYGARFASLGPTRTNFTTSVHVAPPRVTAIPQFYVGSDSRAMSALGQKQTCAVH